jgi:hypothetical protein
MGWRVVTSFSSRVFALEKEKDLDEESREGVTSVKGMGWTAVNGVWGGCRWQEFFVSAH